MGLLAWIKRQFTGSRMGRKGGAPKERGSYDNAQSGTENDAHWSWADALNANAANNPAVRKTLRERARYEADNNGYCGSLIEKQANALVGSCPRLQLQLPATYPDADFGVTQAVPDGVARQVERAFAKWARAVNLGQKLRLMESAATRDGEGFGLLVTNPQLPSAGVQLDVRLYETDQVDTPFVDWTNPLAFPGGKLDEAGNVTEWHFLKVHPGSNVWANHLDYETIPADRVLHWFKPKRAGQLRGVPEILSSLSLFAVLRRYTYATLGAAETASNIAGVLTTDLPPDTGAGPKFEEMDEVDIPRRGLLTLPAGWAATGFEAKQPTTGYGEFKREILAEGGQSIGAPRNVATGSSADYNYSSGRLDHGLYQDMMRVRRHDFAAQILDRIFAAWLAEARLIPGLLPDGLPPVELWAWEWRFPGFVSLDPQKDAQTDDLRLRNGTATYAEIYAEKGEDWEEAFEQQAREQTRRLKLGLPVVTALPPPAQMPAPEPDPEIANVA